MFTICFPTRLNRGLRSAGDQKIFMQLSEGRVTVRVGGAYIPLQPWTKELTAAGEQGRWATIGITGMTYSTVVTVVELILKPLYNCINKYIFIDYIYISYITVYIYISLWIVYIFITVYSYIYISQFVGPFPRLTFGRLTVKRCLFGHTVAMKLSPFF